MNLFDSMNDNFLPLRTDVGHASLALCFCYFSTLHQLYFDIVFHCGEFCTYFVHWNWPSPWALTVIKYLFKFSASKKVNILWEIPFICIEQVCVTPLLLSFYWTLKHYIIFQWTTETGKYRNYQYRNFAMDYWTETDNTELKLQLIRFSNISVLS